MVVAIPMLVAMMATAMGVETMVLARTTKMTMATMAMSAMVERNVTLVVETAPRPAAL